MKTDTISSGQATCLLIVSRLATVATFASAPAAELEWWSVLSYGVTLCLLLLPTYGLLRTTNGEDVLHTATRIHPKIGKVTAALIGVFCLYVVCINVSQFMAFIREALSPDMAATALCVALVVAAFWSALYGIEALARTAAPIAVLLIGIIVAVAVLLAPDLQLGNWTQTITAKWQSAPWWYDTVRTTEAAIIGLVLSHVDKPRFCGSVVIPTGCVVGGMLLIRMTVIGVLGEFALRCFYPYHTAVTAIQAGSVSRMDAVAVSVWIAAVFIKTALFAWAFTRCLQVVLPHKRRVCVPLGATFAAVIGIALGEHSNPAIHRLVMGISAGGIVLFAVVMPLVWIVLSRRRKRI